MLTSKQNQLLLFIDRRLRETGVSPSFDEMKEALGLRSKSGIHRLITGLEERGFIRRLPHRARALEVLRVPELDTALHTSAAPAERPSRGFEPNVIEGGAGRSPAQRTPAPATPVIGTGNVVELPLYGRIAAGLPIEALSDHSQTLDVPTSLLGAGEHYALEVDGDSMIDAGIQDGDTVIIRRCEQADNGDIVVALVDEAEVTLKRLRRKGNSIALEPANPRHETRIFGPDRVRVQGRLVGLIRHY